MVIGVALFKGYNKSGIDADMDLGRTPVHLHVLAPLQMLAAAPTPLISGGLKTVMPGAVRDRI